MNDGPALVFSLIALGAGTLLTRSVLGDSRPWRLLTILSLILIVIACIGGTVIGRPMGPGLVTLLTSGILWYIHFSGDDTVDTRYPERGFLPAAITAGVACGSLLLSLSTPARTPTEPVLVLDQVTERTELLADINLAILEIDLVLERDLPAREQSARSEERWDRLEALTRIRARVQSDRQKLVTMADGLLDPGTEPPDQEALLNLLSGIDRLLGAVKFDR
jgi:hypothetical protein